MITYLHMICLIIYRSEGLIALTLLNKREQKYQYHPHKLHLLKYSIIYEFLNTISNKVAWLKNPLFVKS